MIFKSLFYKIKIKLALLYLFSTRVLKRNNNCSISAGIVFSKDRPLQLEGLLNSYNENVKNRTILYILFKASRNEIKKAYETLKANYNNVVFIPEKDFKSDLIKLLRNIKAPKIFFLVDDIIFIRKFDLHQLTKIDTKKYIPSMRLGENISYSLMKQKPISRPQIQILSKEIISWKWNTNNSYWSYPLSVDGHLFSKWEIEFISRIIDFNSPNSYEFKLQDFNPYFKLKNGCSFKLSVIVNFPWNKIQNENNNISGEYTWEEMLKYWNEGKLIDTQFYYNKIYNSAHVLSDLVLNKRSFYKELN